MHSECWARRTGPCEFYREIDHFSRSGCTFASDEYPVEYAETVADIFAEHYALGMHDVINSNDDGYESDSDTMSEGELPYSEDDWADADLSGVHKLMAMDPKWVPPPLRV